MFIVRSELYLFARCNVLFLLDRGHRPPKLDFAVAAISLTTKGTNFLDLLRAPKRKHARSSGVDLRKRDYGYAR